MVIFTCACSLSFIGQAQVNLVRNPSFEQRDTCPWTADQIKIASYWSCIDTGYVSSIVAYAGDPNCSPEYINGCSTTGEGEPNGSAFYHYPRTGNGMAQAIMYFDESYVTDYKRDYTMGHLYSQLVAGQSYCVTFYTVMTGSAGYAVNHIGAYLDDGSIDTFSNCGYPHPACIPQAVDIAIISDTLNWIKIQGSFIANGTERYITIGNFYDIGNIAHTYAFGGPYSYYLVDDVSVIASNTTAYAGPDVTIHLGDTAWIGVDSNGDGMPCYWYVLGGTTAIDSGGRIGVTPTDTTTPTTYVVMMDLCGTITYDTVVVTVLPTTAIKPIITKAIQVYPNPASNELYVDNAAGCKVSILNMIGKKILKDQITTNNQTLNISNLINGVYIIQIISGSGEKRNIRLLKE